MMQSKRNIDPDNERIRIKHKLWLTGNNNTGLTSRTIKLAVNNRLVVPKSIDSSSTITHDAVENYNNEEGTYSGISSSHYIILMLFQNAGNGFDEDQH